MARAFAAPSRGRGASCTGKVELLMAKARSRTCRSTAVSVSSSSRRMSGRRVVPWMKRVASVKPVARVATKACDIARYRWILRHREREDQRHRPSQPAPEGGDAIPCRHFERKTEPREKRESAAEHHGARGERGGGDDRQEPEFAPSRVAQKARHEDRGQDEDHDTRTVRKEFPDVSQVASSVACDAPRRKRGRRDARGDHRNHVGHV